MAGMLDPLAGRSSSNNLVNPMDPWSKGKVSAPVSALGSPGITNAAIQQNAQDYDSIMGSYRDLLGAAKTARTDPNRATATAGTATPTMLNYSQSPTLTNAISEFGNVARAGGFAGNEQADLRARAISPIRSIYQNAQRNLARNKNLSGGYSPNYNATMAKMARDQSAMTGDAMTNVNAQIAEMARSGRLSAMPQHVNMLSGEDAARRSVEGVNAGASNQFSLANQDAALRASLANSQMMSQDLGREQDIIQGMTSLYGTTPANAQLYGGQQAQQQNIAQSAEAQRNQNKNSIWGNVARAYA